MRKHDDLTAWFCWCSHFRKGTTPLVDCLAQHDCDHWKQMQDMIYVNW